MREIRLDPKQSEQLYHIVARNRSKTRGTELYLQVNDDGKVSKVEYAEIKLESEDIVTPRPKDKREIK